MAVDLLWFYCWSVSMLQRMDRRLVAFVHLHERLRRPTQRRSPTSPKIVMAG